MANSRIQLTQDVHCSLDGQPGIVLSGTVMDVDLSKPGHRFSTAHYTLLGSETAGTPTTINGAQVPTSVRTVRRK